MRGKRFFCIEVDPELAEGQEIYVMADDLRTLQDGSLVVTCRDGDEEAVLLLINSRAWLAVYAASPMDGAPVTAIEHWPDEIAAPVGHAASGPFSPFTARAGVGAGPGPGQGSKANG